MFIFYFFLFLFYFVLFYYFGFFIGSPVSSSFNYKSLSAQNVDLKKTGKEIGNIFILYNVVEKETIEVVCNND